MFWGIFPKELITIDADNTTKEFLLDIPITKILELEPYILLKEQHSADEVPNRLDFYKSQLKNKK